MPTEHKGPDRENAAQTPEPTNSEEQQHPSDAEFEALLATEESMELLKLMGDEVLKAYHRGETEKGGFG